MSDKPNPPDLLTLLRLVVDGYRFHKTLWKSGKTNHTREEWTSIRACLLPVVTDKDDVMALVHLVKEALHSASEGELDRYSGFLAKGLMEENATDQGDWKELESHCFDERLESLDFRVSWAFNFDINRIMHHQELLYAPETMWLLEEYLRFSDEGAKP